MIFAGAKLQNVTCVGIAVTVVAVCSYTAARHSLSSISRRLVALCGVWWYSSCVCGAGLALSF